MVQDLSARVSFVENLFPCEIDKKNFQVTAFEGMHDGIIECASLKL
jgi:hypothetical protein